MSTPDPSTREGEMTNDELDRQIVDRLFPPGDLRVYIESDDWGFCGVEPGGEKRLTPRRFSQDISCAWQVVEKMRADDWLVVVKCNTDAARFLIEGSRSEYDAPCPDRPVGPKGSYVCELKDMRTVRDPKAKWRHDEWALATSAPRAICLAALAAIQSEGKTKAGG